MEKRSENVEKNIKEATLKQSILVFSFMVITILLGSIVWGIRIEILMIISTAFALIIAKLNGYTWSEMEDAISEKITKATPAILIVWVIGIVIAAFMFSGSIPMVIYYGLKIINPQYMYVCAFLVCAMLSIATGTSWGSAATGGVAMMGIATGFGIPANITAAAVICGALVGDKLSPLSETTNLAPMSAGTNIYKHIKSMLWTTVPSSVLSLIVFFVLGLQISVEESSTSQIAAEMMAQLDSLFQWNFIVLVPFIILLGSALLKQPTVPSLIVSSFAAIVIGGLYQGFNVVEGINSCINGFTVSVVSDLEVSSYITTLLDRGGMKSMVGIVVIVYCGYAFAAIISKAGFLEKIATPLISWAKTPVRLIFATLTTNFFISACSGSSYAAFIIVGEMYQKAYEKLGIDKCVLSRSMEDSGTMMLPIVPWSAAGAYYAVILGVNAYGSDGYVMYSLNTFLNPVFALVIAAVGIGMYTKNKILK